MADSTDDNVDYVNGVPRRLGKQTSPGVSGAINDAIGAVAQYVGPKSVTQQNQRTASQIAANDGSDDPTGRMRSAQSSDRDNGYNY